MSIAKINRPTAAELWDEWEDLDQAAEALFRAYARRRDRSLYDALSIAQVLKLSAEKKLEEGLHRAP